LFSHLFSTIARPMATPFAPLPASVSSFSLSLLCLESIAVFLTHIVLHPPPSLLCVSLCFLIIDPWCWEVVNIVFSLLGLSLVPSLFASQMLFLVFLRFYPPPLIPGSHLELRPHLQLRSKILKIKSNLRFKSLQHCLLLGMHSDSSPPFKATTYKYLYSLGILMATKWKCWCTWMSHR